jgi:hypothetical protein
MRSKPMPLLRRRRPPEMAVASATDTRLARPDFGYLSASLSATAGGALLLLYTNDDQRHQLIRDPWLIPEAIEECLRLGSNGYFTFPQRLAALTFPTVWWCDRRRLRRTKTPRYFPIRCASIYERKKCGHDRKAYPVLITRRNFKKRLYVNRVSIDRSANRRKSA